MATEKEILDKCRTVAVVGLSSDQDRPSHRIGSYLLRHGFSVIPVNPKETSILGTTCYPDLKSIPQKVDIVNIFRRSEEVGPIIDQAIEIGAGTIWMQEGIKNETEAEKARKAGITVIQDRCIMKAYSLIEGRV